MFTIIAALGQLERDIIVQRVRSGLANAKFKGRRLGRPALHDKDQIRRLRGEGLSYRAIQRELKVPMGCISRALNGGARKSLSKTSNREPKKTGAYNG